MIRLDVCYLKNMSILLDLKIMFKTGGAIARQLLESRQPARDTLNHQQVLTNRC
jgi:lipopolysaccharide/colanic/teichoic acid biosynthesis glycosyltransferase